MISKKRVHKLMPLISHCKSALTEVVLKTNMNLQIWCQLLAFFQDCDAWWWWGFVSSWKNYCCNIIHIFKQTFLIISNHTFIPFVILNSWQNSKTNTWDTLWASECLTIYSCYQFRGKDAYKYKTWLQLSFF